MSSKVKLTGRLEKIFKRAQPYYRKGREKDELHHQVVAKMMQQLLKEKRDLDRETMMAAALLHDIGYSQIEPQKKKRHWDKQVRKDHMRLGAILAEKILNQIDFPKDKTSKVVKIIEAHDNPEGIKTKEGAALKEADLLWMTTEEAFWLDVKRRQDLGPTDWFNVLRERFLSNKRYQKFLKTDFSKQQIKKFINHMEKKVEQVWRAYV